MKIINMADVVTLDGHAYYCAEIGNRRGKEIIEFESLNSINGKENNTIEISYRKGLLESPIGDIVVFNEKKGWMMK